MDLSYAYFNGYREKRAECLSSDEKAYMMGQTSLIEDLKSEFDYYCDNELEKESKIDEMKKEVLKSFMETIEERLQYRWIEQLIVFADNHGEEDIVESNETYVWNDKEYKVKEPKNWFDDDDEPELEQK